MKQNKMGVKETVNKFATTVMILGSSSAGLYIISKNIIDYTKYDVITSIERVKPKSVTFPSFTICIPTPRKDRNLLSIPSIEDLISYQGSTFKRVPLKSDQLEFFKIPKRTEDCVRFNGFGANKAELEIVDEPLDSLSIEFQTVPSVQFDIEHFQSYIGDNYLNSFLDSLPLDFNPVSKPGNSFYITVAKTDTETKLGEPYNQCNDSLDLTYRQYNAIELCINKEVGEEIQLRYS